MSNHKPALYVSRLLPDPVMRAVRGRFALVQYPVEAPPSASELGEGLRQADAAIVTLTEHINAKMIDSASRLKILANYAVGYNNIDLVAAQRRGLVVTNTPDVLTDATADLTWALILATARRVIEGDRLVRGGRWTGWTPTQLLGTLVSGSTLGIIGMGRIGQAVARRAAGFRMKVLYHARRPVDSPPGHGAWEMTPLPVLLSDSDIVTIHLPLTPDTHHLIGAGELARMRRSAMLINTARGAIVDEAALVDALRNGAIAAAGLDVFENEPLLDPDLLEQERCVLLPHLGSATMDSRVEMGMTCLKNIEAVLSGRTAPNQVSGPNELGSVTK